MIGRFGGKGGGAAAYLAASGARVIDHDERWGTLLIKEVQNDEPIVMVEVVHRTPEADGRFKRYHLQVDPQCRPLFLDGTKGLPQRMTAHAASTFGKYANEYDPEFES